VIRCLRTSITCRQDGVRVDRVAIREMLARIRSRCPPIRFPLATIRFLRALISCMREGVRVHHVAIRETLARIRSRCRPIRKRQESVRHGCGNIQQRVVEFCV
jgi:hypothetical protein